MVSLKRQSAAWATTRQMTCLRCVWQKKERETAQMGESELAHTGKKGERTCVGERVAGRRRGKRNGALTSERERKQKLQHACAATFFLLPPRRALSRLKRSWRRQRQR